MWKWIGAIMVLVILALMGTCYLGYRKLAKAGDTVAATAFGPPAHVFSLLADRDSIAAWLPVGAELTPAGHGPVAPGDTLRISTPGAPGDSSKRLRQVWVVREVNPPATLAVDGIEYDPAGMPRVAMARRDSLVSVGDSTTIVSTFTIFPTLPAGESASRMTAATLRAADRLRLGAAKAQWRVQLRRVVSHLGMP
jgi:hypothetical protein